MFFSVVIPAHNEEKFISETLMAIALAWENFKKTPSSNDQNNKDQMEVIVVNNNSKDQTSKIAESTIQKLQFNFGKVINLNAEKGPSFARARGVDYAQGDIVCFIDADCKMSPLWFKVAKKNLKNKKIVAVGGPYKYDFVKWWQRFLNNFYSYFVLPILPFVLFVLFWKKSAVLIGGNIAVRKEALLKIGGVPQVEFWGDDALLAMLLRRKVGKVKFSPHLIVSSSARRFEKDGFWKVNKKYTLEFFKVFFKHL